MKLKKNTHEILVMKGKKEKKIVYAFAHRPKTKRLIKTQ